MIIQCINCNKKFDVVSSLIPDTGRNLQCSSCNHTWFYKFINQAPTLNQKNNDEKVSIKSVDIIQKNEPNFDHEIDNGEEILINDQNLSVKKETTIKPKSNKLSNFSLSNFFSFLMVTIITLAALIIILDTFKNPLSTTFPSLEILLYNLFETIKDISLFIKNLLL
jgi:predicted Zn finger-like uncharacterized protein